MKKSLEKNDQLEISIKKLNIPDQQIADHWNAVLTNITKPKKSAVAATKKVNS